MQKVESQLQNDRGGTEFQVVQLKGLHRRQSQAPPAREGRPQIFSLTHQQGKPREPS